MCGIFGWVACASGGIVDWREAAGEFFDLLEHRGPDDNGLMVYDENSEWHGLDSSSANRAKLLMGHVRLSILDYPLLADSQW